MAVSTAVQNWVEFGVFLLLTLTSPYLSRLLFGILLSVRYEGKRVLWLWRLEFYLISPVTALMFMAFLYLTIFVSFDTFWSSTAGVVRVLDGILNFLYMTALFFIVIWTSYRFFLFISESVRVGLIVYNVPTFTHDMIREAVNLIGLLLLAILAGFLILVALPRTTFGSDSGPTTAGQVLALLGSLNWITMTIIFGISPVFRDIIAGVTMVVDSYISPNELIRVMDVSKIGYVSEFRLRVTVVRCLDQSLLYIPNHKFLRYPMISYSKADAMVCGIEVPIERNTHVEAVRQFMMNLHADLSEFRHKNPHVLSDLVRKSVFQETDEHDTVSRLHKPLLLVVEGEGISVTYGTDCTVAVRIAFWDSGNVGTVKKLQSEVLLLFTDVLQRHHIEVRATPNIVFRALPNQAPQRRYTD